MNHVLVDYENVHHLDLTIVGDQPVSFVLLLGPKQKKVDAEMIGKLMAMASSVEIVRMASVGKNAVDFALAYYLGRAVLADPAGYFHVVSKDRGYDPLIAHLRERYVEIRRHESCESLSFGDPGKVAALNGLAASEAAAKKAAKKVSKKTATKNVKR